MRLGFGLTFELVRSLERILRVRRSSEPAGSFVTCRLESARPDRRESAEGGRLASCPADVEVSLSTLASHRLSGSASSVSGTATPKEGDPLTSFSGRPAFRAEMTVASSIQSGQRPKQGTHRGEAPTQKLQMLEVAAAPQL